MGCYLLQHESPWCSLPLAFRCCCGCISDLCEGSPLQGEMYLLVLEDPGKSGHTSSDQRLAKPKVLLLVPGDIERRSPRAG